jgi:hypothetical protein
MNELDESKLASAKIYFKNIVKRVQVPNTLDEFNTEVKRILSTNRRLLFRYLDGESKVPILNENNYHAMQKLLSTGKTMKIEAEEEEILSFLNSENFNQMANSVLIHSEIVNKIPIEPVVVKVETSIDELDKGMLEGLVNAKTNMMNELIQVIKGYKEGKQKKTRHPGVFCQYCSVEICGIRYVCKNCNTNICELCEDKHNNDREHLVIKVRSPQQFIALYNADALSASKVCLLSSACLTNNIQLKAKTNSDLIKTVKLSNNGKVAWPKTVTLVCLDTSTIKGPRSLLRVKIDPGKDINIDVVFYTNIPEGEYVSTWQLCNDDNTYFGEKVAFTVTLEQGEKRPEVVIPSHSISSRNGHTLQQPTFFQQNRMQDSSYKKKEQKYQQSRNCEERDESYMNNYD